MSFYKHMKYTDGSGDGQHGPFPTRAGVVEAARHAISSQQRLCGRTFVDHGSDTWTSTDGQVEIWIEEH